MNNIFKYTALAILGVIVLYFAPIFFNIFNWKISNVFPKVILDADYQDSLIRTLVFSFTSTFGILVFSFLLGYLLKRITKGKFLILGSVLLIPFLLGSVSTSFLFKILLSDSWLIELSFDKTYLLFIILGLIRFWQFGTLFIYIFWLNNLSLKETVLNYTEFYQFSSWEKIKNVYLPFHRNLIILLSIFLFVSNIYETTKLQLIFRASKGTNSELISTTLYNSYLSDTKLSPDFASEVLFSQTVLFYLPVFLFFSIFVYFISNSLISVISKSKKGLTFKINQKHKDKISKLTFFSLISIVLFPIFWSFIQQGITIENPFFLLKTIYLSLIASVILLIVFTLPLSYYLRVVKKHFFYEINQKSLWVFILLFLLFLIPPLALMLFGFEWSSIFNVRGVFSTSVVWVIGQAINSLPVIATFIFVIHFVTQNKELEYLEIMKVEFNEVIKWSFLKRFKTEYLMTFLFAFSIIWNEGTFNKVYSDRIPSYVSEILRTVNSRNADYSEGMLFLLFSLLLAVVCITLWNIVLYRLSKNNK